MNLIPWIYYYFHRLTARNQERGEYSAGHWQHLARTKALELCHDLTGKILEVGCGEGLLLTQLAKQNPKALFRGIDLSPELLFRAKQRLIENKLNAVDLFVQKATAMNFADGSFDAVIAINVLMCLESLDAAGAILASMSRVTKTGGIVVFDFRNALNPLLTLKYRLAHYYDKTLAGQSLSTYYPEAVRSLCERLQLNILDMRFSGFPIREPFKYISK